MKYSRQLAWPLISIIILVSIVTVLAATTYVHNPWYSDINTMAQNSIEATKAVGGHTPGYPNIKTTGDVLDPITIAGNSKNAVVDPTDYQPATTFTFAVLVEVDNAQTFELRLYDVTDGAAVAGSVLTTVSATLVELTAVVTLDAAEHIYEVQGRLNTGGGAADYGRLVNAEIRPS